MTSALVRFSGWPVSKVCSARADAATSPSCRRLEEDPSLPGRTDLSVDNIVGLLTLCLDAIFLLFKEVHRHVR